MNIFNQPDAKKINNEDSPQFYSKSQHQFETKLDMIKHQKKFIVNHNIHFHQPRIFYILTPTS